MVTIRRVIFQKHVTHKGKLCADVIAEIDADSVAELPAKDAFEGRILHQGSVAYIVKEGKAAVFSGDGRWYINGEVAE